MKNGNIPFNKGKKGYMSAEQYEKCKQTMFKKGNIPANHRPIGSERVGKDGYILIKIQDKNLQKNWMPKHRYLYEQKYGKIPEGYKWVNAAKIKDIDFEKMQEISNDYKKAIRFWEMYIDGKEPETEEEKEQIKWTYYTKKYYVEKYKNKECYAEIEGTFSTWALLDDTGWYEQGKMGLFATSDSTVESELEFVKKFKETINKPENQNKYLVIVDCHI